MPWDAIKESNICVYKAGYQKSVSFTYISTTAIGQKQFYSNRAVQLAKKTKRQTVNQQKIKL